MDNLDPLQLNIEASASGAAIKDINLIAFQLSSELREWDIESVGLVKGGLAPEGSKGRGIEFKDSGEVLQGRKNK